MPTKLTTSEFATLASLKGSVKPSSAAHRFGVHPQYVRMIWSGAFRRKGRTDYKPKRCRRCGKAFTPTTGNCKTCEECQPIPADIRRAYRRVMGIKNAEMSS